MVLVKHLSHRHIPLGTPSNEQPKFIASFHGQFKGVDQEASLPFCNGGHVRVSLSL
jgi:hypothetical protein